MVSVRGPTVMLRLALPHFLRLSACGGTAVGRTCVVSQEISKDEVRTATVDAPAKA